jgi:fructose-1,6-bisphosphatase/inositol monophosphatase family enzyme
MNIDPEAVSKIIREVAEREVLPRFKRLAAHEISEKSAGDIVTIADERAEKALEQALLELLPGAGVVGEEASSLAPETMSALSEDRPVWVIDPVDGTQNFADGKNCFAMIVALVRSGTTLAGWIHEPIKNTTVWAKIGEGAYEGDRRLHLEGATQISDFNGSLSRKYRERVESKRRRPGMVDEVPKSIVRYRCVGAEYADMARGEMQFARYSGRLKPWDHAAGVLIHAEAGGFSAFVESEAAYRPGPTLTQHTLLLTPEQSSWRQLCDLLED